MKFQLDLRSLAAGETSRQPALCDVLPASICATFSQIEASTSPPPGIPRTFDAFSCPGGREFDELSPLGGGHLMTTHGVGNLIASLDFMLRVALIPRGLIDKSWRRRRRQTLMNSEEKITDSWRPCWKPKAYTTFVPYYY